jgi:polyisoprenyl-phosphate glycosyltransferase
MVSTIRSNHETANEQALTQPDSQIDCSLIVPVYKNEENIEDLLQALTDLHRNMTSSLEIVFVVDGSPDRSYSLLTEALPFCPFKSQLIALSRNFGSFAAICVGIEVAQGKYFAVMAADLQEPPDLMRSFFEILQSEGADVVFGVRSGRSDGRLNQLCSETFWSVYRKLVIPDIPKGGVDVFACNQAVRNAVLQISEPNSSLIAQLFWVGFRRKFVTYQRRCREKGTSAWRFSSRFRYMLDSIFSYSDWPVLMLLWIGGIGVSVSVIIGLITLVGYLLGYINVPGYTTIILLLVFFSSLSLLTQGVIASYLWRAFENTKRRPLALIRMRTEYNVTIV